MFFKGSRYEDVPDAELMDARGRVIRYKRARLPRQVDGAAVHELQSRERLDHVAHRHYQDPTQYWRICDANLALWPDDLTAEAGARLRIPPKER